jgi:hypothetical protein
MIILIDTMAERYGMLPSEVMQRANTFDVFVADTAIGYRNYLTDKANGKSTAAFRPESYSLAELTEFHRSGKSRQK